MLKTAAPEASACQKSADPSSAPACAALDAGFDASVHTHTVAPGSTLVSECEPIDFAMRVERGTLRVCLYRGDGHRKITRFAGPGTMLGVAEQGRWTATIEAVDCAVVRLLSKAKLDGCIARSRGLQAELRTHLVDELAQRDRHLVTLSVLAAPDRVLSFLRQTARQTPAKRFSTLPMNRRDIADHLGLSLETVSRAFTALRRAGVIELRNTQMFRLCERKTLATPRP